MSSGVDPAAVFEAEKQERIDDNRADRKWRALSKRWLEQAFRKRYMYNFAWLGRPIIQLPTDIVALGELIWAARPDLVIETGIAHGGSLVFHASMLALLDVCDSATDGRLLDPRAPVRKVLGVDVDIRAQNRAAIERHPLSRRIEMIEGSSLDPAVIAQVGRAARNCGRILVCLDSDHTHAHVLGELEAYAPLVSKDSYCIVFDTVIEDLPADVFRSRPWRAGDNPKTAVREFLRLLRHEGRIGADGKPLNFEPDTRVEDKLTITAAPGGYLKRL